MLKPLNKKGSIVDVAFLLVVVLGLGIFILVVGKVFPMVTEQIGLSEIGTNANSMEALDTTDKIAGRGDMVFLFIFVGLSIAVFVTSFFIESTPILVPIYIIALGLLIIFAVVAENVYEKFTETDTFSAVAATQPVTAFVMTHLVAIAIGVGVISMVLIFAKPRGYSPGGF